MRVSVRVIALFVVAASLPQARAAGLLPPRMMMITDSVSLRMDKGVEFFRTTEYAASFHTLPTGTSVAVMGLWKTDWQTPEGGSDRIRQDGRWYVGFNRPLLYKLGIWAAASGEHFDDRPFNTRVSGSINRDLTPRSPDIQFTSSVFAAQSATAVRILRGGGGLSAALWEPLEVTVGAGSIQDRRIGSMRSGVGLWSNAAVEQWQLGDWEQDFKLSYNRETPRDHRNEDVSGRYVLYREFFKGTTNRTELGGGWLGRDLYLDAVGSHARREEQNYAFRDILNYGISNAVSMEVIGEVLHERTEQSQPGAKATSLEENQAGFSAALDAQRGRKTGRIEMGIRNVTQTIRGDILQGRKTDLAVQGRLPMPVQSSLAMRLSVSKYVLDTRNENNYDDRDELRYKTEAVWSKRFSPAFLYELQGVIHLDHLVYIFSQNSANNRWTRFFLLNSSLRHRPSPFFNQTVRATVSATYQAYDFETDPYSTRSTVYRRVNLADSAAISIAAPLTLNGKIGWQEEEFGRLYWDSFEEERSDRIQSLAASLEVLVTIKRRVRIGAGGLWDSRFGKRFPSGAKSETIVFQNLKSYGPTLRIDLPYFKRIFFSTQARALRQFQLDREDRWIITGEMLGGFRW